VTPSASPSLPGPGLLHTRASQLERPPHAAPLGRLIRRLGDGFTSGLARLLIRVFFNGVEVEHGGRLSGGRPTVLVADHRNGLVDGLLLMAALRRYPRFLGKSTLFHNPLLWPFLKVGGVVPIYRAQDGGSPVGNRRAFARCHRLLAAGGMVAIFPEGISHDEPTLQPLRTGAARIALSASASGVPEVETVAVTLVYDDKQRFRSRALVRVGTPRPTGPWLDQYRIDESSAVRSLTDDVAERLRRDGAEFASWAEADRYAGIAEVVGRPASALPGRVDLAQRSRLVDALVRAGQAPERRTEMAALEGAFDSYRRLLDVVGLSDGQVAADYGSTRLRWKLVRSLVAVAVALPVAVVGAVVHAVPYGLVKLAGKVPRNIGVRATVKVLGSFFLYALTYAAVGVAVAGKWGADWGLVAALAAPMCGYVTLRMVERIHRMGGAIAGYRAVRAGGTVAELLRFQRASVITAAETVLDGNKAAGP
jgi:glycerol-3-phosphate O-acyltransferase / dihydroxyacetone phosphate acyltransferase